VRPAFRPALRRAVAASLAATLTFSACGGASYTRGEYREGAVSFRVDELPAPWTRVAVGTSNDLAWSHDGLAAVVQVNAVCDQPDQDVPLQALTRHLLNGFTAYTYPPVAPEDAQLVPLDGREAQRTHLVAKLDGVPRELLLVVLKKDDCVYDLALVAPPGERYAAALPAFERLVASFHAGPRDASGGRR
jgi:hypothetical protein